MTQAVLDVRAFGAVGDGEALDTDAINAAIAAAPVGGTVLFPAGRYLCFSIRLRSNVTLYLDEDAVIEGADPAIHAGAYDPAEDNAHDLYQDFGHSHWRNSLIWGDGVENVAITGPGVIDGKSLTREGPGSRWKAQSGEFPRSMIGLSDEEMALLSPDIHAMRGLGNKAIALKNARGIRLSDFTIVRGGHFAILATGCDDMLIENLVVDTNRDGIDIDCCSDVVIRGCRVNTPNDDAIVLKSSLALGYCRPTERVLIEHCQVMGFDSGTMLDGTFGREQEIAPDQDRVTGRIKLGTESSGGFRDITIRNCEFERSRGLALEVVDGGFIENIICRDLTLNEVTTAPIFLRIGDRRRGPPDTAVGSMRDILIENLTATDILADYAAIIAGLPGHAIENVTLRNVSLSFRGGGTAEQAARRPGDLADSYPEPSMFGATPAYGLWVRHAAGLEIDGLRIEAVAPEERPPVLLQSARDLTLSGLQLGWSDAAQPVAAEDVIRLDQASLTRL